MCKKPVEQGMDVSVATLIDILPHLSLTAAALLSGKERDSFYAALTD
jgi:hypothetical protein